MNKNALVGVFSIVMIILFFTFPGRAEAYCSVPAVDRDKFPALWRMYYNCIERERAAAQRRTEEHQRLVEYELREANRKRPCP